MVQTYHHIGIIGFGARGRQLADMVSSQIPEYGRIEAFADTNESAFCLPDLQLKMPSVRKYRDYRELLKDPEIDSVVITTYPESHAQIAIDSIKAGKAVLCDKPVAGSLSDAEKLYRFVTSHPCRFKIGLNLPYYPVSQEIMRLLSEGVIGKLLCLRVLCDVGAEFGHTVILRKFAGQREGLVLGKLTHDSDLLQQFAGSYAEEVYGRTANFLWKRHGDNAGSDDTAVISGVLNNGILFSLSLTSCGAGYGRIMQIFGSKGILESNINSDDLVIRFTDGRTQDIHLPPRPGSHRGGDKVMFSEFLDYADSGRTVPVQPERILSSIMIPLAAMEGRAVKTGEWYRSILK